MKQPAGGHAVFRTMSSYLSTTLIVRGMAFDAPGAKDQGFSSIVSGGKASSNAELANDRFVALADVEGPPFLFLTASGTPATCDPAHLLTLMNISTTDAGNPPTWATDIPLLSISTSTDVLALVIAVFNDWPYTVSRKAVSAILRKRMMLPT